MLHATRLLLIALVTLLTGPVPGRAEPRPEAAALMAGVRAWAYQLQNYTPDMLAARAAEATDLLVIDYAKGKGNLFTFNEIQALKRRPDGGRRLVVAYFSIGEAEEYRPYWNSVWEREKPPWLIDENCRWPSNHLVRFWKPGWRDMMFWTPDSYLAHIMWAGFDGVYLDRIDVYMDLRQRYPEAAAEMKRFVSDLAGTARARNPNFIVIAQNAEDLLADPAYRAVVDAVAKEDLLYGVTGTGRRNPDAMIAGSLGHLDKLRADGKPVFAVEYLETDTQVSAARAELATLGMPTVFATRALDGRDPVAVAAARAAQPPSPAQYGTPEYAAERCDGVFRKPATAPAEPAK